MYEVDDPYDDESYTISTDQIIDQLGSNVSELDKSFKSFLSKRVDVLESNKIALAKYEREIEDIENSAYFTKNDHNLNTAKKTGVDHNILKHLNIDRQNEYLETLEPEKNVDNNEDTRSIAKANLLASLELNSANKFIEKNKRLLDAEINVPPPTFEEKRKVREDMFNFFEESTIEETRLELEIEQAKDKGDKVLVEELSEALFILQLLNSERLTSLITDYRPQAAMKSWGNDPEYTHMTKQLVAIAEEYKISDTTEIVTRGRK